MAEEKERRMGRRNESRRAILERGRWWWDEKVEMVMVMKMEK